MRDIDLSHPPAVAALVRQVREQHGAVAALVHLAALRPGTEALGTDPERWQLRLAGDLKGLFLLTQALHGDLERSGAGGGAVVLGASALGGAFASDRPSAPYFPGNGAITGFLKTVAEEWTGVRVKAVDLGPAPPATAAGWLLSEMMAADGLVEVGYRNGRRTCLRMEAAPLAPPAASRDAANQPAVDQDGASIMLDRDTVLLVTGGARGITAEAALVLAAAHKPTLVLVGRTPMPAEPEPPETAGITEAVALKRAIIESRRRAGAAVTPGQVEVAYRRILHEREMRENLARFERTGARVMYFPCDVRDAGAFGGLIDRIYEEYGRIDGVLHGAGVIEDKLVRDKTPDSFDRVVGTKVDGILTLAGKLRPESLRFVVFFGSVSGRFGNRGQADYAAASEVMNKLALDLDRRWPARVVSINWGPWLTTGMATPEIQRQFAARGVELIPVEVGCRMLEQELRFGSKGDVEVIVGGFPPAADRARTLPLVHSTGGHTRLRRTEDPRGGVELTRTLSLANDPYLDDHRLDGRPVLPMAIALELMVETARAGWPDLDLLEVRDLRLLHGITVDAAEHTVRVQAHPVAGPDSPTSRHDGRPFAPSAQSQSAGPRRLTLDLAIFSDDQPQRVHYQAVVELGDGQGTAPATDAERGPGPLGDAQPVPPSIDDAYRDWLFHGPRFRGITALDALGRSGLRARVRPSTPQALLANSPSGEWLVDPLLIDCALQLQLIWARHHWNVTSLPLGIRSYRPQSPRPAPAADGGEAPALQGEMRLRPGAQSPISLADHFVYAPDGRLLFRLEGVEMAGSTAANRLTGQGYREHQAATNEAAGGV